MASGSFDNLFIFVADALRYDYCPESIAAKGGGAIKTLAPSLHSPQSFASLLTGLDSANHSVNDFFDTLEPETGTIFDHFPNTAFYDHEDSAIRIIFGQPATELEDMEEPFVWVERAMETHEPYGVMRHGNDLPDDYKRGKDYFEQYEKEEIKQKYVEACQKTADHFWRHIEHLKEKGLYDDTLIIFTADHGDCLGERIWGKERWGHNNPPCQEIAQVPTVFLNADVDTDHMRSIDIMPSALSLCGKENPSLDGKDLRGGRAPAQGSCQTTLRLFNLTWRHNRQWVLEQRIRGMIEDGCIRTPLSTLVNKLR